MSIVRIAESPIKQIPALLWKCCLHSYLSSPNLIEMTTISCFLTTKYQFTLSQVCFEKKMLRIRACLEHHALFRICITFRNLLEAVMIYLMEIPVIYSIPKMSWCVNTIKLQGQEINGNFTLRTGSWI